MAETFSRYLCDVDAVVEDCAGYNFCKAEKRQDEGALSGPGPTDNSNALAGTNLEVDIGEDVRPVYVVSDCQVPELNLTLCGPILGNYMSGIVGVVSILGIGLVVLVLGLQG